MEPRFARRVSRSATTPFTGALGQRKFIYPDHATASKLPHRENHNAPGRRPEAAALLHPSKYMAAPSIDRATA